MKTVLAIVAAAGSGNRLRKKIPKLYLKIGKKPLLAYSLLCLEHSKKIDQIIVVSARRYMKLTQRIVRDYNIAKVRKIVAGGKTRSESVNNGLKHVPPKTDLVLIHDGARPFISQKIIDTCIKTGLRYKAVICAVPCVSTIKSVDEQLKVITTLNRNMLWQVQTPQVFDYKVIKRAYQRVEGKKLSFSDDSALVEKLGHKVKVVFGSYLNMKITTPEDLKLARAIADFN
ncbi:MAG: 2-C-methyl-D-erythritol 4-phosphate cytidylyltransferase [Candidatus Omnitrophota bacterium]